MWFVGRCQEIRAICVDFEPCLEVHTLISVQRKSIKTLSRDPYQRAISCGGVKKFETRASSLRNLEMAYNKASYQKRILS